MSGHQSGCHPAGTAARQHGSVGGHWALTSQCTAGAKKERESEEEEKMHGSLMSV